MKSKLEEDLARQMDLAGMSFRREVPILPGRRWRADFKVFKAMTLESALTEWARDWTILVEVNGQGPQGRHGSYGHAESDAEKLSAAACLGYRVLTVTGKQVRSGQALAWIRCALGLDGTPEEVFSRPSRKYRHRSLQAARKARLSGRCVTRALPERVKRAAGLA